MLLPLRHICHALRLAPIPAGQYGAGIICGVVGLNQHGAVSSSAYCLCFVFGSNRTNHEGRCGLCHGYEYYCRT